MQPFFEPVVFWVGPLRVHGLTLALLLALATGPVVGMVVAWRHRAPVWPLVLLPFGAVAVAWPVGRLAHLLTYADAYRRAPFAELVALHTGTSLPAAVAGTIPVLLFVGLAGRRWAVADGVAVAAATASLWLHWGLFLARYYPGAETEAWLGFQGICEGHWGGWWRACHDLGLYGAIGSGAGLAALLALAMTERVGWAPALFAAWSAVQLAVLELGFGAGLSVRLWPVAPLAVLAVVFVGLRLVWSQPLVTEFDEDEASEAAPG